MAESLPGRKQCVSFVKSVCAVVTVLFQSKTVRTRNVYEEEVLIKNNEQRINSFSRSIFGLWVNVVSYRWPHWSSEQVVNRPTLAVSGTENEYYSLRTTGGRLSTTGVLVCLLVAPRVILLVITVHVDSQSMRCGTISWPINCHLRHSKHSWTRVWLI